MRQLRVLQFITPSGFYGAERWVIALANNANRNSMLCDLAVTREGGGQDLSVATHYPESAGDVHYLEMKGRFDWRAVRQLLQIIRNRQIDVIHTHGYKSDILGFLAARLAGIKCVSTPHGFSGKVGFKLATFIRIGALMLRYFDAVAPLSEELVDDIKGFNVSEKRIHFIRNGVDLKDIDESLSALAGGSTVQKGTESTIRKVGFIGQMIPRKGIPDLLDVFDELYGTDPTLRLELLGDGHQRTQLEAYAKQKASVAAIHFLGFRTDRLAHLTNFDLFVMTSSLEGIPRCLMEAMAIGVPCVAYDIPGVDQLIEHGHTGLLVPHGDKSALAKCCRQVLDDPALARRLVEAARRKIETQYSAARMAAEYDRLFRSLIEGTADPVVSQSGRGD